MASVPSRMALATSEASARVGRGLRIIESSIWVAVMTGLPASLQARMIRFWAMGTSSGGASTPRSPRATISPSEAARISSMQSSASGFSILAMMGVSAPCFCQPGAQVPHVVVAADEGQGKIVHLLLQGKGRVGLVLFGDRWHLEAGVGQAEPLARVEHPAHHDLGLDALAGQVRPPATPAGHRPAGCGRRASRRGSPRDGAGGSRLARRTIRHRPASTVSSSTSSTW